MNSKFSIPCTFDAATRKKDRSISLKFTSNREIPTEEYMILDGLIQHSGWLVYSDNEIQASEVPGVPADEAYGKMSDSQYQRWILKKIYEKTNTDLEWPDWYHQQEAKINNRLLDKLKEMEI